MSSSIVITRETTLAQLIELGLIKATQIETFNKRLDRKASKAQDSEAQTRANQAVAFSKMESLAQ